MKWTYDAKGRRIGQRTWQWTNSTWQVIEDLQFVSDPMSVGRHILEVNASNNAVVRSYVWGLDLSGSLDGAGGGGGLLWITLNSGPAAGTHFCAYDGNGNVVGLINAATGTETARYEYGPFGEPIRVSGPAARPNPFRFSAKRTDDTTDLVLYEYRAYSPTLGHWLSRDPVEEEGGVNLYSFCRNTPASEADIYGLWAGEMSSSTRSTLEQIKDAFSQVTSTIRQLANSIRDFVNSLECAHITLHGHLTITEAKKSKAPGCKAFCCPIIPGPVIASMVEGKVNSNLPWSINVGCSPCVPKLDFNFEIWWEGCITVPTGPRIPPTLFPENPTCLITLCGSFNGWLWGFIGSCCRGGE